MAFRTGEQADKFWTLVERAHNYHQRAEANQKYYDKGHCGGCPTCGEPPHDIGIHEVKELLQEFKNILAPNEIAP